MNHDESNKQIKISELIHQLEKIKIEHGDLFVWHNSDGGYFEAVTDVSIANNSFIGASVCYLC